MISPMSNIRNVSQQPVSPVRNRQTPSKKDQLANVTVMPSKKDQLSNVSVVPPRPVKGGLVRSDTSKRPTTGPSKKDQLANVSVVPEGPSKADQVRNTNYTFTPQSPDQQAPADTSQEPSQNYASQMQGLVRQADRDRDVHTSSILRQAQESAVRGGYAPGTAGYDQLMEKASADAATAGMEIRQSVNQPLVSAMGKDLDRQYAEQDVLLGQYAEDPQAMEYIGSQLAQGKSIQDAITSMYDDEGNRLEQYKPKTDSQLARDALIDSTLQMKYGGRSLEELTPEERQEIERTSASLYDAMYQPVTGAVEQESVELGIQENVREGRDLKKWSDQELNVLASRPDMWESFGIVSTLGEDVDKLSNRSSGAWSDKKTKDIANNLNKKYKVGDRFVQDGKIYEIVKSDNKATIDSSGLFGVVKTPIVKSNISYRPVRGGVSATQTISKEFKGERDKVFI